MRQELRRALEQVARRFRHARLWSGLAICWLAWAVAGLGWFIVNRAPASRSIPFNWLVAALVLAAVTGRRLGDRGLALGARPALGGPAHRGEISRAGHRPPGRCRGRRGVAPRPAGFLADRRHSQSPRPSSGPRLDANGLDLDAARQPRRPRGGTRALDRRLRRPLSPARSHAGGSLTITSGARCLRRSRSIRATPSSSAARRSWSSLASRAECPPRRASSSKRPRARRAAA